MLGTLASTLVLLSTSQTSRYTLSTTIHAWSTATFDVAVNGKDVLRLKRKEKIDLEPYLRRGENTLTVRYRTDDGKPSFHQPAILIIESWNGTKRRTELRVAASLDNPRGKLSITIPAS